MYGLALHMLREAQRIRETDYQNIMQSVWMTYESCAALLLDELGFDDFEIQLLIFRFHNQ